LDEQLKSENTEHDLYEEYILKIVLLFDFRMMKLHMQNCHQCMAHQP